MTRQNVTVKRSHLRLKLIGEIISELKKVVWLTKREAIYLTFLVLVVSLAVGLILGVFDYGFARLVDEVFLGR